MSGLPSDPPPPGSLPSYRLVPTDPTLVAGPESLRHDGLLVAWEPAVFRSPVGIEEVASPVLRVDALDDRDWDGVEVRFTVDVDGGLEPHPGPAIVDGAVEVAAAAAMALVEAWGAQLAARQRVAFAAGVTAAEQQAEVWRAEGHHAAVCAELVRGPRLRLAAELFETVGQRQLARRLLDEGFVGEPQDLQRVVAVASGAG